MSGTREQQRWSWVRGSCVLEGSEPPVRHDTGWCVASFPRLLLTARAVGICSTINTGGLNGVLQSTLRGRRPHVLWCSPRSSPMWLPSRRQRTGSSIENAVNRPERPYRPAGSSDPRDRGPHVAKGFGKRDRRLVYVALPGGSAGGQFSSEMNGRRHRRPGCRPQLRVREADPHLERTGEHESGGSLRHRR